VDRGANLEFNKNIEVIIIDLLCLTPFYDKYLFQGLKKRIQNLKLITISFHKDISYFKRNDIRISGPLINIVARIQINKKVIRQLLKTFEYILNLFLITNIFILKPPDIIYIQWVPFITKLPFEVWFLNLMKFCGIKIVYTVHNVLPHDTGNKYMKCFSRVYKIADLLICHTEHAKQRLVSEFKIDANSVEIIPHGPMFHDSIKINHEDARLRLGFNGEVIVLFFGLLRQYKGIDFLLQAWKEVLEQCSKAFLLIVGDGDRTYKQRMIDKIIDLGISETVKLELRFVSNDELVIYHQAADILVYPYKEISQSGALLTGMTFGKPIVATTVGGIKEILVNNETAVLVDYGDVNGFSKALVDLIKDPHKRGELGGKALDLVHSKYSWDMVARKTIKSFYKLMNKGKTRK